mmetsp:Transcript_15428/g.23454  ORF Transcript_15428/g.23454 Transcript_15428/m.23454 type:complete len:173 (-) Transcript_15428:219-737(-)
MFFICCPLFESLWIMIQNDGRRQEDSDAWLWHHELFVKIPIQAILTDISFYTIHYTLHQFSLLYQHIHKVHHRFVAPTAMTCVYAHPLEFAFGNIFPIFFGPMLTNAHPFTCWALWFPLATLGTCIGHCGYRIFGHYEDPHDKHHSNVQCNYGGMCISDYIFGTLKVGNASN